MEDMKAVSCPNKCYWVHKYFVIDGEKIFYLLADFYYGQDESTMIDFKTFNELYLFAKDTTYPCEAKVSMFGKKYVVIPELLEESRCIYERNFSDISFVRKYIEFKPTIQQCMEYLTVEEFKEYTGFHKSI